MKARVTCLPSHSTCHCWQQTLFSSDVTLTVSMGVELQTHIACHGTNINPAVSVLIMYVIFIAHDFSLRYSMVALPGRVVRRIPLDDDAHPLHVFLAWQVTFSAAYLVDGRLGVWRQVGLRVGPRLRLFSKPPPPPSVHAGGASLTTLCHDITLLTHVK